MAKKNQVGPSADKPIITCFRPHEDLEADYWILRDWCKDNRSSFSSVINSFLPAIAYAVQNCVHFDVKKGERFIRADFGDIVLREIKNTTYGNAKDY